MFSTSHGGSPQSAGFDGLPVRKIEGTPPGVYLRSTHLTLEAAEALAGIMILSSLIARAAFRADEHDSAPRALGHVRKGAAMSPVLHPDTLPQNTTYNVRVADPYLTSPASRT